MQQVWPMVVPIKSERVNTGNIYMLVTTTTTTKIVVVVVVVVVV